MKPQDALFNWTVRKDAPGTQKPQLPIIIVTPPPIVTKPSVHRKKRPRNTCHAVQESAPKKLVLDPGFWSQVKTDAPQARKQKHLFKCRNVECAEQFSSTKLRNMHQRHCLTFNEVCIHLNC